MKTVRYRATEMAWRVLTRLHPVGVQIFQAQLHVGLQDMWRGGSSPVSVRNFLPLQLTDLDNGGFGGGWTGIELRSRGVDDGLQSVLIDLVIEGREWGYREGDIIIEGHLPQTLRQRISDDPIGTLGLPPYIEPMNVMIGLEDRTIIRIRQSDRDLAQADPGRLLERDADEEPLMPLAPMGRRLAEIGDALQEQRVPFENAMRAYADIMDWYHERGGPWTLEQFTISREWMIGSRGADCVQSVDVKRSGGSLNPELTPAEQTLLELDELNSRTADQEQGQTP